MRSGWPATRTTASALAIAVVGALWYLAAPVYLEDESIRAFVVKNLVAFAAHEVRFLVALATVQCALVLAVFGLTSSSRVAQRLRGSFRRALLHPERTTVALALLGATITLAIALFATELHTSTEDEKTYLFQAQLLRLGRLSMPLPSEGAPFVVQFLVQSGGRWSGQYFWAQPALLAMAGFVGTPWIATILEVAATIWFSGRAASRFTGDERVGLLTSALVAISPLIVINGATLLNTNLAASCAAASLWAIATLREGRSRAATWVLALSTGIALHNRPLDQAALLVPAAVLLLLEKGRGVRETVARFAPAVLLTIPFIALHPLLNLAVSGDPWVSGYALFNRSHGWKTMGFGVGPFDHVQTAGTAAAKTITNAVRVAFYATGCPLVVAVAALGSIVTPSRTPALRAGAPAIVATFYAAYFFYVGVPILVAGPVYFTAIAPVVCAWLADSLLALHDRARSELPRGPDWMPILVVGATIVAVVTLWPPLIRGIHRSALGSPAARAARLAEARGLHHALVFVANVDARGTYEMELPFPDPELDDDVLFVRALEPGVNASLAARFGEGRSVYLMDEGIGALSAFDPVTGGVVPLPAAGGR